MNHHEIALIEIGEQAGAINERNTIIEYLRDEANLLEQQGMKEAATALRTRCIHLVNELHHKDRIAS